MLGGIFNKRKKCQELRSLSLQDVEKFRDVFTKFAELRQVESPLYFEKSIDKALASQKELHTIDLKHEDINDAQVFVLAEALLEMPIVSSLDLRHNQITDHGAKALLELLRLQIVTAKTPRTIDLEMMQPFPQYTRFLTSVNLKGNNVSSSILQELSQYLDVLRREDKRLEIRVALARIDCNNDGTIAEEGFKKVLNLLTAPIPTNKEIRAFMQHHVLSTNSTQNALNLENLLLAKCGTPPSKRAACPPWEALVQEQHANLRASEMISTMMASSQSFSSHIAPVPPIEAIDDETMLPPTPVGNNLVASQRFQSVMTLDEPQKAADGTIESLQPLVSDIQYSGHSNSSFFSARSSVEDEGNLSTRENNSNFFVSVMSSSSSSSDDEDLHVEKLSPARDEESNHIPSPHDSVASDNMSANSIEGSILQPEHDHSNAIECKIHPMVAETSTSTHFNSSRWQFKPVSIDDDGEFPTCSLANDQKELTRFEDCKRSTLIQNVPSSFDIHEDSKYESATWTASMSETDCTRESVLEYSSDRQVNKCLFSSNVSLASRLDGMESFHHQQAEEEYQSAALTSSGHSSHASFNQPEHEGENVKENEDLVIFSVAKGSKEFSIVKLRHSRFKKGLPISEFPTDLQFRNILALLLPENGLIDLKSFVKCRFPFVLVLDLSRNNLIKLRDEELTAFPRLEVLNLARNQLKAVTGLSQVFKLRALGLSHNGIRVVKNLEHLVHLQILHLANNEVATVNALRLLSLNTMLTHFNLDANPVIDVNEHQKRRNIVHVRNLLPGLQSFGSISLTGMYKDKKNATCVVKSGKSLFDSDTMPDFKSMWISMVCDKLCIFQDASNERSSNFKSDNGWESRDNGKEKQVAKPLTRAQQRLKDQERSRALRFRSREKAIPSPPKIKTSVFCFGPPPPTSLKMKLKDLIPADPNIVREQQRRSSELSAPKYIPVDQNFMRQEQNRKSRVDFHGAMTVGEKLQLARDMAQRQPTAAIGLSARSRLVLKKADTRKRASTEKTTTTRRENSIEDETNSPVSEEVNDSSSKKVDFLHELAVADSVKQAEEEFATTLTAFNVLLSISEKEQDDYNKLNEYRASLDAFDILHEHGNHELVDKIQQFSEHELQVECIEWRTKMGILKKCMRQLLEKLENHAPGSAVIRAYCRYLRSSELSGIISTMLESQQDIQNNGITASNDKQDTDKTNSHGNEFKPLPSIAEDTKDENFIYTESSANTSVVSRLFGNDNISPLSEERDDSILGISSSGNAFVVELIADASDDSLILDEAVLDDLTDTTVNTQTEEIFNVPDCKYVDDNQDMDVVLEENEVKTSDAVKEYSVWRNTESSEACESTLSADTTSKFYDTDVNALCEREQEKSAEAFAFQNEDYWWLDAPAELDIETQVTDSFDHKNAVSEDEAEEMKMNALNKMDEIKEVETYANDYSNESEQGDGNHLEDSEVVPKNSKYDEEADEEAEIFGDWEKGFDPNFNHYFWFNHATMESSWIPPEGWPYRVECPVSPEDAVSGQETDECDGIVANRDLLAEAQQLKSTTSDEAVTLDNEIAKRDSNDAITEEQEDDESSLLSDFEFHDSDLPI